MKCRGSSGNLFWQSLTDVRPLFQGSMAVQSLRQYVEEEKYTEICPEFKGSYVEEVYNTIRSHFHIGRIRFLMKPPRTCLSWHRDPEKRLHIPIITNKGNIMVIDNEAFHMPSDGAGYITDNTKYHNFFNGSEVDRVHLVATIIPNEK